MTVLTAEKVAQYTKTGTTEKPVVPVCCFRTAGHSGGVVVLGLLSFFGPDRHGFVGVALFENLSAEQEHGIDGPQDKENQAGVKAQGNTKQSQKVGRNDSCPCGSGKKYKNCCGK